MVFFIQQVGFSEEFADRSIRTLQASPVINMSSDQRLFFIVQLLTDHMNTLEASRAPKRTDALPEVSVTSISSSIRAFVCFLSSGLILEFLFI